MTDLNDLFKAAADEKRKLREQQENSPAGKALKAVQERLKEQNEIAALFRAKQAEVVQEAIPEFVPEPTPTAAPDNLVNAAVTVAQQTNHDSFQQPAPQQIDQNIAAMIKKMQFLEQAIGKIAATGPGSGEVNLRWLDDVDRSTIQDNRYLRYSAASKKFIFDDVDAVGEYLTFWDTTSRNVTQSAQYLLELNSTNGSRNITLENSSKITFTKAGTYIISYSLQLVNTGNEQEDVNVWIKKNGQNVEDTNSIFTVPARKNTSITGKMVATSPIPVDVNAGDYIQVYLHTDSSTVNIDTVNDDSVHGIPRSPSAILVVTKM